MIGHKNFDPSDVGVPDGEGESIEEVADRLSDDDSNDDRKDISEVYRDRNVLACVLAELFWSGGWTPAEDVLDPEEWTIVWVETPYGQASWHVPRNLAEGTVTRDDSYEYDGHDRGMKNDRLLSWAEDGCPH